MDESNDHYHKGASEDIPKANSPSADNLKGNEQSFYHGPGINSRSTDKAGLAKAEGGKLGSATSAGLYAVEKLTPFGKLIGGLKKHKKGAIGGGGGLAAVIVTIVLLFTAVASHELVIIEQDLLRYEDKAVAYIQKKASKQILKRIMCRKLDTPSCNKIKESEGDDNASDQAAQDDDPLASEVDKFNFEDPTVADKLEGQGIGIDKGPNGEFAGFTDNNTGQPITADDLNDPALQERFETAIPEWDVGQMEAYRPLMIDHAQATFDPVPNPDDPNVNKDDVQADILDTENNGPQLEEASAEDSNQPNANETPQQQADASATQNATNGTNDLLEQATKDIAAGESEAEVVSNTESSVNLGQAALANTAISDVCSIDKIATTASKSRIPTIIALLVRHATTLISIADEMKNGGKMSGHQISQVTSLFNGDPKYSSTSNSPTERESALPFDRSAAWLRINGHGDSINPANNPDISQSAKPINIAGTGLISTINGLLSHTGGSVVCSLENNSIFGTVVGLGLTGLQLFGGTISFGASEGATIAVVTAIQETIKYEIIPQILKYFTPVGIDGLEDSVQWMNNADAGANLSFNMFAQRMGGKPLTNSQAVALASEGSELNQVDQNQQSFYQRTLAFSDPSSLVSKLIVDLPLSRLGIIEAFGNVIVKSPILLIHSFGNLLGGTKLFALAPPSDPGQPYDITQYGFTNSEITRYDPISNEQYLYNTTVDGQSLIQLLGNPNNSPNAQEDTNPNAPNDVLHCFTQGFQQTASETGPDPICGTMGNFNTQVTPQPITNQNVGYSFCQQLEPGWQTYDPGCPGSMAALPQLINIMPRFRQYLLDDEVVGFYTSLNNNQ